MGYLNYFHYAEILLLDNSWITVQGMTDYPKEGNVIYIKITFVVLASTGGIYENYWWVLEEGQILISISLVRVNFEC